MAADAAETPGCVLKVSGPARLHSALGLAATRSMSAWRRIAVQKIPKQRGLIERSESVGMLWVDLWFKFVEAHRQPADVETIRGVYEFAKWTCAESGNDELATSTYCHFYEDLPKEPLVRERLPQYMARRDFLELVDVFKYHLTPQEHETFVREFLERAKVYEDGSA